MYWEVKNLPRITVGLVFWAGVKRNGAPSDILQDRLDVAIEAYKQKKIKKIIVSWDNSHSSYNEPAAMEKYLILQWIPKNNIYLDYAGFDTFDSIYRMKHIFWVKRVILFTQNFHLKRALYIAKKLDIEVYGISTSTQRYLNETLNNNREILARVKAFLDVDINRSKPKFLWESIDMNFPQNRDIK